MTNEDLQKEIVDIYNRLLKLYEDSKINGNEISEMDYSFWEHSLWHLGRVDLLETEEGEDE